MLLQINHYTIFAWYSFHKNEYHDIHSSYKKNSHVLVTKFVIFLLYGIVCSPFSSITCYFSANCESLAFTIVFSLIFGIKTGSGHLSGEIIL